MRDYIASNKEYGETTLVLRGVVAVEKVAGTTALMFHKVDAQGNQYISDILDINVWDIHSDDTQITNKYAYDLEASSATEAMEESKTIEYENIHKTPETDSISVITELLFKTWEEVVEEKINNQFIDRGKLLSISLYIIKWLI